MRDDILIQAIDNTEDVLMHGIKWSEEAKERVRQARRAGRRVSEMFGNLYNKGKFKKATTNSIKRSNKGTYDPDVDAYVSRKGGVSTYTHKNGTKTIIGNRKSNKGTYDPDVNAYVTRKGGKSTYTHPDGSKTIIEPRKSSKSRKNSKGTYDPDVDAYVRRKGNKSTYTHKDGTKTIIDYGKSRKSRK